MNETLRASFRSIVPLLTVAALFSLGGTKAHAQTAPANATIGNQASASYTDGSNITRTATSNTVVTTVLQVPALSLTANNIKVANPGSPIYYPHTVTNTGNGNDSYTLGSANLGGDNFDVTGIAIYADADGNGVPDSTTPITATPTLAPGESFRFVVAGTVPSTATSGQNALSSVTATSTTSAAVTASNQDRVNVTNNAAIEVTKSSNTNSGPGGTTVTYTLTYRNTGNATATALNISDTIPANMTYVAGSGTWSKSATALTDPTGGDAAAADGTTINYTGTTTGGNGGGSINAIVGSVPAQTSGAITFRALVATGTTPQVLNNVATFSYNDGSGTTLNGTSNTVPFTVTTSAGVTLGDSTVPTAAQGAAVVFTDALVNTGNAIDTFNITINPAAGTNTFPAGTNFKFFKPDGVTPLVDTNGDGIVDTGPVAPGAGNGINVVLIAQLPSGQVTGPFTVQAIARSVNNPAVFDPGVNTVNTITTSTVEITNAGGAGAGPLTPTPVTTLTGAPGTTQRFTLNVQNTSTQADSYALQFSNTNVFTPSPVALPAGFTVTFRDASGAVLTNTGVLAPNATRSFFADVFIPANATSQNVDIFFRAFSSTSGASDSKFDRVTVTNVAALAVEPNNFGQVFPGGTIVYPHTVTNQGNSPLTNVALTLANTAPGFTAVAYEDTNGDGILSPAESATPLTNIANLPAGATVNVLVKVFAPAGVDPNTSNVTTLTATSGALTDNATDTTTVVSGDLKIDKEQSVDPDGAGPIGFGPFTKAAGSAGPGAYVRYRITVTNTGNVPVTNVVINDTTPGYTVYWTLSQPAAYTINGTPQAPAGITGPTNGNAGSFTFNVGTLAPGGTAVAVFGIRINP